MKAEVLAVNRENQFAAVRTDDGITVFYFKSRALAEGDIICGDLANLSDVDQVFNESRGEPVGVITLAAGCSDDGAIQLMFV